MNVALPQIRAARALLGWSQESLAAMARVGVATVRRYELDQDVPEELIERMVDSLKLAGIVFIGEPRKLGSTVIHTGVALREGAKPGSRKSPAGIKLPTKPATKIKKR